MLSSLRYGQCVLELNRRQVLALTGMSAAAAGIGAGLVGLSWWNRGADTGFLYLDESEAQFIRTFAGAAWPATESIPQ